MYLQPHSEEAEQAILGSMLISKECCESIPKLEPEDFYSNIHETIFAFMQELYNENSVVDIVTVSDKAKTKNINRIELMQYLTDLVNMTPTTANFKHYLNIVNDSSIKRRIFKKTQDIAKMILENDTDMNAVELKNYFLQEISDIKADENKNDSIQTIVSSALLTLEDKYNNRDDTSYYTGFFDLDKATAGLHSQELTLIAARPSLGKTAFGIQIGENIANKSKHVYLVTREMSNEQLVMRMISRKSEIDSHKLRLGKFDIEEEWLKINEVAGKLSKLNMTLDDRSRTIQDIRARARELKRTKGLGLIIVDYIQLLQTVKKTNTRHEEVASISRELKLMTLDFGIPIIAMAQLNREADSAKRPQLGHLGESSALEKDADNVIFLHKEHEFKPIGNDLAMEEVEVILAKQRNGPTGIIKLGYRPKTMTFVNLY